MSNLFNDPRGDAMQFIADTFSEWGSDAAQTEAFFAGFFAAMKIYNAPCPVDPYANIVKANTWAARQIMSAEINYQNNELHQARSIINALTLDKDTVRDFLLRADFQGGMGECKSHIFYTNDQGAMIGYETYHNQDSDLEPGFRATLYPMRILVAPMGNREVVIRSDDHPMMTALIEWLLEIGDPEPRMEIMERFGGEPEPGCLDLRPYAAQVMNLAAQQEHCKMYAAHFVGNTPQYVGAAPTEGEPAPDSTSAP